jgi:hypothetical protein
MPLQIVEANNFSLALLQERDKYLEMANHVEWLQ